MAQLKRQRALPAALRPCRSPVFAQRRGSPHTPVPAAHCPDLLLTAAACWGLRWLPTPCRRAPWIQRPFWVPSCWKRVQNTGSPVSAPGVASEPASSLGQVPRAGLPGPRGNVCLLFMAPDVLTETVADLQQDFVERSVSCLSNTASTPPAAGLALLSWALGGWALPGDPNAWKQTIREEILHSHVSVSFRVRRREGAELMRGLPRPSLL